MKKIFCILMALFAILTFVSCDNSENDNKNSENNSQTQSSDNNQAQSSNNNNQTPSVTDINSLPLEEAYEFAAKQFQEYPETQRDIGELQLETKEIVLIDGKYYQSYILSSADLRYIFISNSEYRMSSTWDWLPIGTTNTYSLDLLGRINEGYK